MTHGDEAPDAIWPPPAYFRQLALLRQALGKPVYLAEFNLSAINGGVRITDEPRELLAVLDFPRPDPHKQLYPHFLLLDDGQGINLGRIARISLNRAFGPDDGEMLYQNQLLLQGQLFAPRTLSRESIRATSTALLAQLFGDQPGRLLESAGEGTLLEGASDLPKTQQGRAVS